MSIADELQKLEELRRTGALTESEFAQAKAAVLAGTTAPADPPLRKEVAQHLAEVSYQNDLARVDREWEIEREQYLVMDRFGRTHIPQPGGAAMFGFVRRGSMMGGIVTTVFGIGWTILAYNLTRDAPFPLIGYLFPGFGILFVLFGLATTFGFASTVTKLQKQYEEKAARYQEGFARYQERRRQVMMRHGVPVE